MQKVDRKNRIKRGNVASLVGIAVNVFLGVLKVVIGSIFGLISVLADGLNNLTDCGNNIISVISFKLSSKPADKEHPYGHERIEYVFSMIIAVLIVLVAFDTLKESISSIINPAEINFSYWVIGALIVSVVFKIALYFYYKSTAKKINSSILKAGSIDCLTDVVSTSVVLICFIVGKLSGFSIDGYAGVFVSLFIGYSAFGILKEIFSKLIGQAPDESMLEDIKNKIKSYDGVLDVHDLAVYSFGPNKYFASVHVEVDANVDVLISHELIDDIERDFAKNTNVMLTGHLDPIVTDDLLVNQVKEKVIVEIKKIDSSLSVHDFRMVCGKGHTNVLFDVAVPFGTKISKEEIYQKTKEIVSDIDQTYRAVVTVENCL